MESKLQFYVSRRLGEYESKAVARVKNTSEFGVKSVGFSVGVSFSAVRPIFSRTLTSEVGHFT